MQNMIPPDHLRVQLDTRRPIQIETSVALLDSLANALRSQNQIGIAGRVEIIEVHQGSWWAEVAIIVGTLAAGAGVIANSAESLALEIREGRTPFGRAVASASNEGEADRCEIVTSEIVIEIAKREMRGLVGMIPGENQYGRGPYGTSALNDEGGSLGAASRDDAGSPITKEADYYLTTENGDVLTTEDGDPITTGQLPDLPPGQIRFIGRFHRVGPDTLFRDSRGRLFAIDPAHPLPAEISFTGDYILIAYESPDTTDDGLTVLTAVTAIPT